MVLSPERLVASLNLTRTSRVLEIGPGPGFFSIQVAQAVPDGRLELVDIQMEMLLKARGRLRRASLENVGTFTRMPSSCRFVPAPSMLRSSWLSSARWLIPRGVWHLSLMRCDQAGCFPSPSCQVIKWGPRDIARGTSDFVGISVSPVALLEPLGTFGFRLSRRSFEDHDDHPPALACWFHWKFILWRNALLYP